MTTLTALIADSMLCDAQAHPNLHRNLDAGFAAIKEVLIELDTVLLERDNDRRATKLKDAKLLSLLDLTTRLAKTFMDTAPN
jgi:hypothetical protein